MTRCDPSRLRRLSGALSAFRARRRFTHAFGNITAAAAAAHDAETRRKLQELERR